MPTDEQLVALCKKELPGNTRSYELLVQRHLQQVYRIAYRVVGNQQEAEDVTQEVFLKVFGGLKKFEEQATFSTWLYRVALNTALDTADKNKRRPQKAQPTIKSNESSEQETDVLNLQPSQLLGPEDSAIGSELRRCINQVLKKLEDEQRNLLVMRDFDDRSYDEIAQRLNVGLSAIKMRIHRARLVFQEHFIQTCGKIYLPFSTPAGAVALNAGTAVKINPKMQQKEKQPRL